MFKYTPAKKILKQLARINSTHMPATKKFELANMILTTYLERWTDCNEGGYND